MNQDQGPASANLTLAWSDHSGRAALKIGGWAPAALADLEGLDASELSRRFALLTTEALQSGRDVNAVPPVAGRFGVEADSLYFIPRFPFVPGAGYSLVALPAPAGGARNAPEIFHIQRPAEEAESTAFVVAIHPDAATVPVNLLKIYVRFSEPMSEGRAQRAIKVCRDDTGEPLEGVFVPMDPELWDPARQRMALQHSLL